MGSYEAARKTSKKVINFFVVGLTYGWSRTTTYTVIKRLSERGVVVNENAIVRSLVSKDEIQRAEIEELIQKRFDNSLPAFVAAFAKTAKLTDKELAEIKALIEKE